MRSIRLVLADDNPEVLETLTDMLQPDYIVAGAVLGWSCPFCSKVARSSPT